MRIGISRTSGGGNEAFEVFAAAKRHGFDGVQAKPSQYSEDGLLPDPFIARLGELAALVRAGLVVYPGDSFAEWPAKFAEIIAFASAVKANHLCICCGASSDGDVEARRRVAADALMAVGREAGAQGMSVSLHNHAGTIFESIDDLEKLFALLDGAVVGLTLDTAHAAKGGIRDLPDAVRRFSSVLRNVHLKDIGSDGAFCPLGTGVLDLTPVVDTLRKTGYEQWLIVDEESGAYTTDEAFRIARAFLRERGL
ncbi:MAG: TIM barrel protein [Chitinivibrionales bacterium]|nr:TIM barrel protein [Chitinivibrionales bacterium]